MKRVLRAAAILALWLCLLPAARACPWFWPWPFEEEACLVPVPPPPVFRAAPSCPCQPPGPAPCPTPGSPRPVTPAGPRSAVPTPAPPSATMEPPLADPPGTPPAGPESPPPPLAPPPNPAPAAPSSRVQAARFPTAAADASFFDTYIRTAGGERRVGDRCVVSFQNLTGREVSVEVDGKRQSLPAGQTWRVEPPRQFVWRMEGRPAQSEAVSTNLVGLEIVLRR